MARKTESGSASSNSRTAASLNAFRHQIDKLDQQILKLVNDRAKLAVEIGKVKQDQASNIFAPAREEEALQNDLGSNQRPMDEVTVRPIYREIMSGSPALPRLVKIANLGSEDSYSH